MGSQVKVVAHRGASAVAPENTMAAFVAAQEAGADGVELDVHATADGELVVIHDYLVDRTTDGTGLVFELPAAEVARLDAGSWFGPAFAGEPVPRLADVLALAGGNGEAGLELEVELKDYSTAFMERLVAAVDEAGMLDRTELTSWNTPMLMALKARFPAARTGLFSARREPWMTDQIFERRILGTAEFTTADVVHVYAGDLTEPIAEALHRLDRRVHANDAASAAEVQRVVACGADRLSTDDVATALAVTRPAPPAA